MNTHSNTVPDAYQSQPSQAQPSLSAAISPAQALYWSVRRELWENRSIYIAPLVVAGAYLLGFMISAIHLPEKMRAAAGLDPMQQHMIIERPYDFIALLIMGAGFLVAFFYCLEALHGERRDRSILFWKSMPVSDLTTVLSKMCIPVVVLPLLSFAITIATQWVMLLVSSAVLMGSGQSAAMLWVRVPWIQMSMMLLFHLVAIHGLWYAPFYGWLLLVSAWAKRATFLWATVPLIAIGILEKVAFSTSHFSDLLGYRFAGGGDGTTFPPDSHSMHMMALADVGRFLVTPGLWVGLAVTAGFLALAIRLRHDRGPI
ncbi:MAG: ABC transporter permease [Terriglobales bacterium]